MAATTVKVEIPEELVALLKHSKLGDRPIADQLRFALAVHLLQEGVISTGKAASLAGENRFDFESLLMSMGIPTLRYDLEDLEQDRKTLERLRDK